MNQHTPTPWYSESGSANSPGWEIRIHDKWIGTINNSHGETRGFPSNAEGKANIELVLRAVNSHEELLAAAKHFQECLRVNGCSLCALADKAISKAEARS